MNERIAFSALLSGLVNDRVSLIRVHQLCTLPLSWVCAFTLWQLLPLPLLVLGNLDLQVVLFHLFADGSRYRAHDCILPDADARPFVFLKSGLVLFNLVI